MRKLTLAPALWAFMALLVAATASAEDRPRIVAVNYAIQSMAERLVGDAAEVVMPVPEGVDPSFWRPSIADISMIQSSDLILLNGAGFATWIDRVSLPRSKVVNTSAGFSLEYITTRSITHSHGDGGEHSHEGTASYVWLDPVLAAMQAEAIAAALTARSLAPEGEVESRLAALRADLESLDEEARAALSKAQNTRFIATHPRYHYLARAYGLSIDYLEWEAGAAPDADQLADLQARVADSGATVLIWEADPPQAALEATADLGLTNVTVAPLAQAAPKGAFLEAMAGSLAALAAAAGGD